MPKRSRKTEREDVNEVASRILGELVQVVVPDVSGKNPAAVELGRLGGLKGGKARAARLSPRRRSQIAREAALVRWSKRRKK